MGQGGRTGERVEMVAARAGKYALVEDKYDWWVAQIMCLFRCISSINISCFYIVI
jgi:hypothetical protein